NQARYLDANTVGLQMLGYTLEELRALTIIDVSARRDLPRYGSIMAQLTSGAVVQFEGELKRKDGSTFLGEIHGWQLSDGRIQAFTRDITERKQAEQALATANAQLAAELEGMVRLHTIAMHSMSEPDDISALFGEMLEAAIELTKADGGVIRLLN